MALLFLDASAVVKLYVQEVGTAWLRGLASPAAGNSLYLAAITEVEVTAALARRRSGRSLVPAQIAAALRQFQSDLARGYRVVAITPSLLHQGAGLADRHHLRAYDAVQLAAAATIHAQAPALILISADAELNAAAGLEGIAVDDPNAHP